jgi:hypothetical protein
MLDFISMKLKTDKCIYMIQCEFFFKPFELSSVLAWKLSMFTKFPIFL